VPSSAMLALTDSGLACLVLAAARTRARDGCSGSPGSSIRHTRRGDGISASATGARSTIADGAARGRDGGIREELAAGVMPVGGSLLYRG
jgi:hypothetical protein